MNKGALKALPLCGMSAGGATASEKRRCFLGKRLQSAQIRSVSVVWGGRWRRAGVVGPARAAARHGPGALGREGANAGSPCSAPEAVGREAGAGLRGGGSLRGEWRQPANGPSRTPLTWPAGGSSWPGRHKGFMSREPRPCPRRGGAHCAHSATRRGERPGPAGATAALGVTVSVTVWRATEADGGTGPPAPQRYGRGGVSVQAGVSALSTLFVD